MSSLRARCPACGTLTAVALGPDYQCHVCGREYAAGLVRVPRAWGRGGEQMALAAGLGLPYPEAAVVAKDSLNEQSLALAADLPGRPLVLGGCCCAHVGPIEGLAARHGTLSVIWFDAHGDLNTPETSPSGNAWGMPLRMVLDSGAVEAADVALVGARNLDSPEREFIASSGIHTGEGDAIARALARTGVAYLAFDADVVEPGELAVFMPEPGGLLLSEVERLLSIVPTLATVIGAGLTGLRPDPANVAALERLAAAIGL